MQMAFYVTTASTAKMFAKTKNHGQKLDDDLSIAKCTIWNGQ